MSQTNGYTWTSAGAEAFAAPRATPEEAANSILLRNIPSGRRISQFRCARLHPSCVTGAHARRKIAVPGTGSNYEARVGREVAYFFAGIERIDHNLGRLRKALDKSGKASDTILIFLTDNGGTAGVELYNAGMRGRKGQVYDGGHRVPFFIHWPAGGLARGADIADLNAHIDVLPTLIDLCGLTPPRIVDFDGRSFKKQLFQPDLELPARTLFVEQQRTYDPKKWTAKAGRTRRWRLVDNRELYDIEKDPGQTNNVIERFPEVVERIRNAH